MPEMLTRVSYCYSSNLKKGEQRRKEKNIAPSTVLNARGWDWWLD
jgi:hypothetical protein